MSEDHISGNRTTEETSKSPDMAEMVEVDLNEIRRIIDAMKESTRSMTEFTISWMGWWLASIFFVSVFFLSQNEFKILREVGPFFFFSFVGMASILSIFFVTSLLRKTKKDIVNEWFLGEIAKNITGTKTTALGNDSTSQLLKKLFG